MSAGVVLELLNAGGADEDTHQLARKATTGYCAERYLCHVAVEGYWDSTAPCLRPLIGLETVVSPRGCLRAVVGPCGRWRMSAGAADWRRDAWLEQSGQRVPQTGRPNGGDTRRLGVLEGLERERGHVGPTANCSRRRLAGKGAVLPVHQRGRCTALQSCSPATRHVLPQLSTHTEAATKDTGAATAWACCAALVHPRPRSAQLTNRWHGERGAALEGATPPPHRQGLSNPPPKASARPVLASQSSGRLFGPAPGDISLPRRHASAPGRHEYSPSLF